MTTPSPTAEFSGVSLHLHADAGQLWLTNAILGRCCGISAKGIQKIIDRNPAAFSEADTRLEKPDLREHGVPADQRYSGAKTTRIWSFPEGCLKAAMFATTPRAKQFGLFLLAYSHSQTEHHRLKALQREHYLYSKRPRLRQVAQGVDAGLKTRAIAEAVGFRSLESVRRNRREALRAGLLATPALPEAVQLQLFAPVGEGS